MNTRRSDGAQRQLRLALGQADALDRLRAAAKSVDPDPEQVLEDIAKLTDSIEDARYAINAARNVARVKEERIAAAIDTTHQPDTAEWRKHIAAHIDLDEGGQFTDRYRLQYATRLPWPSPRLPAPASSPAHNGRPTSDVPACQTCVAAAPFQKVSA